MRNVSGWLGAALFISGLLTAAAGASRAEDLVFLSTQLRPIEEAQKMRKVILKDFPREVDYVTEQSPQLPVRIKAEQEGGTHTIDVVGALRVIMEERQPEFDQLQLHAGAAALG
jgi:multiple sugar transport system substrate-binding protein